MNIHIHHFDSKRAVADEAALEQLQKQWATYQKLVDADALAHKEVVCVSGSAQRLQISGIGNQFNRNCCG